jgi:osmotically inducible protein OsmC
MPAFRREAVLEWTGEVVKGSGEVVAGSGAFALAATFPRLAGEPAGTTTPEELLAASHATCFGIALRSVLAQRGATAERIRATATLTADKGGGRIRIVRADLEAQVEGLAGLAAEGLDAAAQAAEEACTISVLLRASVPVTARVIPVESGRDA